MRDKDGNLTKEGALSIIKGGGTVMIGGQVCQNAKELDAALSRKPAATIPADIHGASDDEVTVLRSRIEDLGNQMQRLARTHTDLVSEHEGVKEKWKQTLEERDRLEEALAEAQDEIAKLKQQLESATAPAEDAKPANKDKAESKPGGNPDKKKS